jgi:hypothetical protein
MSTAGNIRRKALDSSATSGSNGRQLIGSLDQELGARFFNLQRRHAQIAVIGQGQTDQLLQLRVNKNWLDFRSVAAASPVREVLFL